MVQGWYIFFWHVRAAAARPALLPSFSTSKLLFSTSARASLSVLFLLGLLSRRSRSSRLSHVSIEPSSKTSPAISRPRAFPRRSLSPQDRPNRYSCVFYLDTAVTRRRFSGRREPLEECRCHYGCVDDELSGVIGVIVGVSDDLDLDIPELWRRCAIDGA